ncbi:hypothetical protein ACPEEZ_10400 [Frigoribacterium sp. 2-23]|uniref:hypothetical protein n=1 Tax=Frigoribacterium sp. 2-23 TaxID=3415006 RepID=UPI003C6F0EC0
MSNARAMTGDRSGTTGKRVALTATGRWVGLGALVYVLTRIPFFVGFVAAQTRQGGSISWAPFAERWDGWWYLYLAEFGYPDSLNLPARPLYGPWGFFPIWPWFIRLVARMTGLPYDVAAGFVTAFCAVGLLAVLGALVEQRFGRRTAVVAVLFLGAFPGSLALSMPYTEGLFLLSSVLAIYTASRSWWWWSCIPTFVACATRSTGVAVLAALFILAVATWRRDGRDLRPTLPLLAGLAAFAGAAGYAFVRTGDPFIWRRAQEQWNQRLDFGAGLWKGFFVNLPQRGIEWHLYGVMAGTVALMTLLIALALPYLHRLPLYWWAYGVVMIGLVFAYSNVGPRPRMILALLPLFVMAAITAQRSRLMSGLVVGLFSVVSVGFAFAVYFVPYHVTA